MSKEFRTPIRIPLDPVTSSAGLLGVGSSVLGWGETDLIATFIDNVNSYSQIVVQNKNSGPLASSDIIFYNNSTPSGGNAGYLDLGKNSSGWITAGPWNDPNGGYLYSSSATLAIGTDTAHDFRIATNGVSAFVVGGAASGIYPTGTASALIALVSPSITATSNLTAATTAITTATISGNLTASAGTTTLGATTTGNLTVSTLINTGTLSVPTTTGRIASTNSSVATALTTNSNQNAGTTPTGFNSVSLLSGRTYEFRIFLFYKGSATTVALRNYLNYPTLTRGSVQLMVATSSVAFSQVGSTDSLTGTSTTITSSLISAANTVYIARLQGVLVPSANGTFSYQFGTNAAAPTASVLANSYMVVTEIG